MAKQVFESLDLVRHIYGFGPEHRDRMAAVCESIVLPSARDLGIDTLILPPQVTETDVLQYFRAIRCRCCTRHSQRKTYAVISNRQLYISPNYTQYTHLPDPCDCYCRQQSRMFVRRLLTYETFD